MNVRMNSFVFKLANIWKAQQPSCVFSSLPPLKLQYPSLLSQLQSFWDPALRTAAAQHPCWSWSLNLDFNLEIKSSSKNNDLE